MDTPITTMAHALEGMAEIDEEAARSLLPNLRFLLGEEASMNTADFEAQQETIIELYQHIRGLQTNAQGIRQILKLAEGDDDA